MPTDAARTDTQRTDPELLDAARAGDPVAMDELLARHEAQIYRFGMKMCRHPEDAEDVLQETLLALARGARDLRGASSVSTWLYSVARSYCIKKRRRRVGAPSPERVVDIAGPGVPRGESAMIVDTSRPADEALADKRVEAALQEAIRALEPKYREVLLLRDVEGLTAPEVAEVLGIRVDAVKSRLHRARAAVRAQVAPLLDVGEHAVAVAPSSCPEVVTLFSKHLEGDVSADRCAEMERHLATCSHCRGACASLKRTLVLCRSVPAAEVPLAVQQSVREAVRAFLAAAHAAPSGPLIPPRPA